MELHYIYGSIFLLVVLLINFRYGQWQNRKKPVIDERYEEFTSRIEDLEKKLSAVLLRGK